MLDGTYFKIPLGSITLVLFDIGTPNLMGGCHHCPKVCRVPKPGHCDIFFTLDGTYFKIPLRSISLVLFDIGTPNLMGGCVITQRCVAYQTRSLRPTFHAWPHLLQYSILLHFSCTIWHRDNKLNGWVCHRPKVCRVLKLGHRDLLFTLDRTYFKFRSALHLLYYLT